MQADRSHLRTYTLGPMSSLCLRTLLRALKQAKKDSFRSYTGANSALRGVNGAILSAELGLISR
eukprot:3803387-Rhodomonas_salina.2